MGDSSEEQSTSSSVETYGTMNKRKRTIAQRTPEVLDDVTNDTTEGNKTWTDDDKENLLKALKTYGHTNIDNISVMLPNKTKPAIKLMIHKIMQKAKAVEYDDNSALNTWIESGTFDDKTQPIPEALKFIAFFEKHPPPAECGGFNFRAAYVNLHRLTLGFPAIDLPKGTLKKVHALMDEVETEVWPSSEDDILAYLSQLNGKKAARKCYPPKKKSNFTIANN